MTSQSIFPRGEQRVIGHNSPAESQSGDDGQGSASNAFAKVQTGNGVTSVHVEFFGAGLIPDAYQRSSPQQAKCDIVR